MVAGVGYSILNQLPQLDLPQYFASAWCGEHLLGAVLWLAGARVGGREEVCDKCWWAIATNAAAATSISTQLVRIE